jgi:hypothetical protein
MSENTYDAIASLTIRLSQLVQRPAQAGTVIATPNILTTGTPDLLLVGIIQDARVLINPTNNGLIPNVLNRLRRESTVPVEIISIKASGHNGNVVAALETSAGIVVFHVDAEFQPLLNAITNWGVAPIVKEVEKVVVKAVEVTKEVEVPAKSWWARTFG